MDSSKSGKGNTFYIRDLDFLVKDSYLAALFNQTGFPVRSCQVLRSDNGERYAVVEFTESRVALDAKYAMEGRKLFYQKMEIEWPTNNKSKLYEFDGVPVEKIVTSQKGRGTGDGNNCTVFVGGSSGMKGTDLLNVFGRCGQIKKVKICKEKGIAFVTFATKCEANNAVASVHTFNGKKLRCSFSKS